MSEKKKYKAVTADMRTRILRLLATTDLTVTQLAARFGVSANAIRHVRAGRT